jgi:hypothetical protein
MRRVLYQLYVIGAVARRLYYKDEPETDAPGSSRCDRHSIDRRCWRCSFYNLHPRSGIGRKVNFFRRETRLGRAGMKYSIDLTIVVLVMSFAFVAPVIEIAVWAMLFVICARLW